MKTSSSLFALSLMGAAVFAAQASAQDTVTAIKVAQAPNLAAGAADPAWAKAQPLTVPLAGGTNFKDGKTTATIKAVYTGDMLYMLVQYDDPTAVGAPLPVPEAGRRQLEEAERSRTTRAATTTSTTRTSSR